MDERDLKLECLRIFGRLDSAQEAFAWVAGELSEPEQIKSAQAYQVIGALISLREDNEPLPSDDELARALDYFADTATVDEEFLPWPREKARDMQAVAERIVDEVVAKAEAQIPEGFIEWKGGKRPVPADMPVRAIFRGESGAFPDAVYEAGYFVDDCWEHNNGASHIVAYQPVPQHPLGELSGYANAEQVRVIEPKTGADSAREEGGLARPDGREEGNGAPPRDPPPATEGVWRTHNGDDEWIFLNHLASADCEVRYRDNTTGRGVLESFDWRWSSELDGADIVAFRLVVDPAPPTPAQMGEAHEQAFATNEIEKEPV